MMEYQLIRGSTANHEIPNSAFLYGESVFTTIKVVLGVSYFWNDHWQRLKENVAWLWGNDISPLKEIIKKSLEESLEGFKLGAIRITFYKLGSKLQWVIHGKKLDRVHLSPLLLKTVFHPCFSEQRPNTIKLGVYGEILKVKREVQGEGWDDILLMNRERNLLETTFGNLVLTKGQCAIFPHYEKGYLSGITKKHLMIALKEKNWKVEERVVHFSELPEMDSAWVTSSISGVRAVEKIDQVVFTANSSLGSIWLEYLGSFHE